MPEAINPWPVHWEDVFSVTLYSTQWHPTPVLLPGKSHGWRSLEGCSPWGRWGLDMTERLHFHALEKEMATHSSVLDWRIPGTGEPGGPPFMGSHRVGHDWSDLATAAAYSTQRLIYWWQVPFTLGGISAINRHFLSLAKWEILSALSYFIFNFFRVQRHYHELPLINNILSWG